MRKMNKVEKLEHILAVFSKKILPGLLFASNPELFLEWQGNFCKQAAILNHFIIENHLPEDYVKVEAWEGFFESETQGSYNHCWNYIIHKDDSQKNIICDFTSTIQNYFDFCPYNDPTLHIGGNTLRVNKPKIDMIMSELLNLEEQFDGNELYTGASEDEIKQVVVNLLKKAKLWQEDLSSETFTESMITL